MWARRKIIAKIKKERERQQKVEGWSNEHDDRYINYELSKAAATYALGAAENNADRSVMDTFGTSGTNFSIHNLWPFSRTFHKPVSREKDLIKAAALIIAELERLSRIT